LYAFFRLLALLENFLRLLLVGPEIRLADFLFECGQQCLIAGDVKDSSARAPCEPLIPHTCVVSLQSTFASNSLRRSKV
jgi:hypothetical protein